jgi:hypothetical protein
MKTKKIISLSYLDFESFLTSIRSVLVQVTMVRSVSRETGSRVVHVETPIIPFPVLQEKMVLW